MSMEAFPRSVDNQDFWYNNPGVDISRAYVEATPAQRADMLRATYPYPTPTESYEHATEAPEERRLPGSPLVGKLGEYSLDGAMHAADRVADGTLDLTKMVMEAVGARDMTRY